MPSDRIMKTKTFHPRQKLLVITIFRAKGKDERRKEGRINGWMHGWKERGREKWRRVGDREEIVGQDIETLKHSL